MLAWTLAGCAVAVGRPDRSGPDLLVGAKAGVGGARFHDTTGPLRRDLGATAGVGYTIHRVRLGAEGSLLTGQGEDRHASSASFACLSGWDAALTVGYPVGALVSGFVGGGAARCNFSNAGPPGGTGPGGLAGLELDVGRWRLRTQFDVHRVGEDVNPAKLYRLMVMVVIPLRVGDAPATLLPSPSR